MADTVERRTLSLQGAQRVLDAAIGEAMRAGLHVSIAVASEVERNISSSHRSVASEWG